MDVDTITKKLDKKDKPLEYLYTLVSEGEIDVTQFKRLFYYLAAKAVIESVYQ